MLIAVNLTIRFVIELCALVALGYWGFSTGDGALPSLAMGLGAPVAAMLAWGAFVAPAADGRRPHRSPCGWWWRWP